MADGEIYHTVRFQDSWQPWGNVSKNVPSNPGEAPPGYISKSSCAAIGNDLHVVASTPVPTAQGGSLYHTIRFANLNYWQPWGRVSKVVRSNKGQLKPSVFVELDCAGIGNDLHIIGATASGKVYHTIRFANSNDWQHWNIVSSTVANNPGPIKCVKCAAIGNNLHVVVESGGKLYHVIRYPDGSWDTAGWLDLILKVGTQPGLFADGSISCADVGSELHIIGANASGNVWHTIRFANNQWQNSQQTGFTGGWGHLNSTVKNNPGPFYVLGCAGVGYYLHLIGQCDGNNQVSHLGNLYHTIRYSRENGWQPWGDVTKGVASNPGEAPPTEGADQWMSMSCAGIGNDLHVIGNVKRTIS